MDLSKIASFITLEPSQLFRAERFVEQGLKMYDSDEELTEAYLKENLHGVTLDYAMHVLDESSTSYMDVAIHNQGGKFSAPTAGVYGVSSRPEIKKKIKDKVLKKNELEKKQRSMKKEEVEQVDELYKGKHGQTEKQYQDSRSDGGKMISGDSKGSGASYSSRGVKNTGPNPAGGSKKPQGQGRMTSGARTELQFRKAALKKKANEEFEIVNEEDYDRMKDRRMERGGVGGNQRYDRPSRSNTAGKKPSSGMSAFDKVAGDLKKKYGEKAIYAKKTTKEEVVLEKKAAKDYDGDGKIESGSKEHAGVVHNAIQRAKGKKADGKDTRKEEVVSLSDSLIEGKVACKKCNGKGCDDCKGKGYKVTHNCSSKVEHAEWGSGECIKEMHTLDENGHISHYDVLFAHGIEENVSVEDLTTLVSEMHEHAINDEKNEVVESMKQARKNVGASKCWKGYKAQGTKTKDGKVVPNCVKEDEELEEGKRGLWDNIHAKRKRGEKPAKPGDKDYPKTLNVEETEEVDEANIEIKGKKKGNVIINPEVKKVTENADATKKQQIQRKQLMINRQKLALQQRATAKKKPTDMHMEETENIQEVDTTTRSVDYGQEIENTTLKRKKEKKSLSDFKKLSKPKES